MAREWHRDTVITNAVIVDQGGIIKSEIGIKDGPIAGIGKAGNPDIQPGITIIIGPDTEIITGEHTIVTAGGIDTHIHFICPHQTPMPLTNAISATPG